MEHEPLLRSNDVSAPSAVRDVMSGQDGESISAGSIEDDHRIHLGNKLKIAAIMFMFFTTGMKVTTIGALLTEIEEYYKITDGTAAFIFPTGIAGYICGTSILPVVLSRHGWRGMAFLAPLSDIIGIVTLSMGPSFVCVLLGHFVGGLGTGLSDAGFCALASRMPYANVVQGLMHGSYSMGSVIGPMVFVAVVKKGLPWYIFYRVMVVLACLEAISLILTFRSENVDKYRMTHMSVDIPQTKSSPRMKVVWLCGLFYFFYVAVEVSFSNWIPTFMKRIRHADTATGSLSSSAYWIGMALGRLGLGPVTEYSGLGVSVAVYILLATFLQIAFRFVQNIGVSLMLLAANGFFLGPMYPSGIVLISKKLSQTEYVGGVAAAASMGQVGGALSPIAIGFMAEKFGLEHLTEVMIVSSLLSLSVWIVFSRVS